MLYTWNWSYRLIIISPTANLLELIAYHIGSSVIIKSTERSHNWMLFFCNTLLVYITDISHKSPAVSKECKKKYYLNILKYHRCEEFV